MTEKQITYTWHELGRTRWSQPYHPNMLRPKGLTDEGVHHMLVGACSKASEREAIKVNFDRDYAIAKAANSLKSLFIGMPIDEVSSFINDLNSKILKDNYGAK